VQAWQTIPRHGVNTVDASLQERVKSRKYCIVFISVIENPPKVDILLNRATYVVNPWISRTRHLWSGKRTNPIRNSRANVKMASMDVPPVVVCNLHLAQLPHVFETNKPPPVKTLTFFFLRIVLAKA
jgi:hypothetical protein